jgi:hypothetical protein
MCVVGKNYRLQDIQLSKNPPTPLRGFGAAGPRPEAADPAENYSPTGASSPLADSPPSPLRGFGAATFASTRERRLVENTGLEPVTSWLQTRRSPS